MFDTKNTNYGQAVRSPSRTWKISVDILPDNRDEVNLYTLDNDDIVLGSFTFEEASTCSDNIEIGSVFANNIAFSLQNTDGKFNGINLLYARVRPVVSLLTDAETNEWAEIPLVTFYITEAGKKLSTIPVKAMDGMYKLNRRLGDICSTEDLALHNVLSAVLNYWGWSMIAATGDELRGITERLPELADDKLTCRDFVSYTAALLGKSARFNRDGRLEFFGYSDTVYETTPETRTELTLSDLDIEVTGVAVIDAEDNRVDAEGGSDKYVVVVGKNPLLFKDGLTALARDNAAAALLGQKYTPYSCGIIGDPAVQCGDRVRHIIPDKDGGDDRIVQSLIMSHRFAFRSAGQIDARGKPPEANRQLTATAKKIIEIEKKAAKDLNDGLDEMQRTIVNQTDLLTSSLGFYTYIEYNEDGSIKAYYMMNKKNKDDANTVWVINENGIGLSHTGIKGPFTSGWTSDDSIVASIITADMIKTGSLSADLIKTGTINADLIKAGKIKADYIDTTNLSAERLTTKEGGVYGIIGQTPGDGGYGLFIMRGENDPLFSVSPRRIYADEEHYTSTTMYIDGSDAQIVTRHGQIMDTNVAYAEFRHRNTCINLSDGGCLFMEITVNMGLPVILMV